jgi:hypothetical protein
MATFIEPFAKKVLKRIPSSRFAQCALTVTAAQMLFFAAAIATVAGLAAAWPACAKTPIVKLVGGQPFTKILGSWSAAQI